MLMAFYFLSIEQIILGLILGWLIAGIGISVVMHRYISHKTFEFKNKFYKALSYIIAFMSGYCNPVAWGALHRQHHACPDSDEDPYSPMRAGKVKVFCSMFEMSHNEWIDKQKELLFRDKFNEFFTDSYTLLTIAYPILLYLIFGLDAVLIFIGIVVPVCIFLQGYINAFLHDEPVDSDGYYSKNMKGSLFWFGENLHKTHHITPNKSWQSNWDLGKYYIKLVGKNIK